jgi:3-isopropylmalate/(R)-2-methylmalate dehydratase small subunit
VSEEFLQVLFAEIEKNPNTEVEVNLENQTISLPSANRKETFEINSYKKKCLLNGYDDIDYLISIKDKIEAFEKK